MSHSIGQVINDSYTVEEIIPGGMAEVLVCRTRTSDRVVLKAFTGPATEAALRREAAAWARLGTAQFSFYVGLRRIIGTGARLYLELPYCSSGNLRRRMTDGMSLPEKMTVLTQILIGLWHIEQAGLIHCDLKPENVLFNEEGDALLTDLGIARALHNVKDGYVQGAVGTGERTGISGTLPYMAPEQLLSATALDSRVDLWAFGVLAVEVLTGRRPFVGADPDALVRSIMSDAPKLPPVPESLPPEIHTVIARLLQKNPDHRYPNVKAAIVAWDNVVDITSDNVDVARQSQGRISITDTRIRSYWNGEFFPDRIAKDHELYRFSYAAVAALQRAERLYQVDENEAAIHETDKVLDADVDGRSLFDLYCSEALPKRGWTKRKFDSLEFLPGQDAVESALSIRLKSYVALLSELTPPGHITAAAEGLCARLEECGTVQTWLRRYMSQVYVLCGRYEAANRLLNELLEEDRHDSHAWNTLFLVAFRSEGEGAARRVAENAASACGHLPAASYVLAHMWGVLKSWPQAIRYARMALEEQPDNVMALNVLGGSLWNSGERDNAKVVFRRLMDVAPNSPEAGRVAHLFK